MVTKPSRRSFLTGRRTPATPWGNFCARLSRTCVGRVQWDDAPDAMQAWLDPSREGDLTHAFALCREFGVQYLLAGSDVRADQGRAVLWVSPQAPWATVVAVDAQQTLWRADAGSLLRTLQGVGIRSVDDADPEQTIAQWVASHRCCRWPTGQCDLSDIVQIQVLLADGTTEVFGPFGASAQAPLKSLATQRMIPKLFELAHSESFEESAAGELWPLRFRLDALRPTAPLEPNLAWLFLGHGGSLGWVQTVWFSVSDGRTRVSTNELPVKLAAIDRNVKQILDPSGVFGSLPE